MKLIITLLCVVAMTMADDASVENLLVQSNNQFTAKMFSEVAKANLGKSMVLSAFSVLTPLAQLELASVGDSHDELAKAIGIPNENDVKEVFTFVNNKLRSVKGIELKQASRIYIPTGYELNDNFAAVSRDVFQSDAKNVDFTKNTETAGEINNWVEEQTNHRIKDLVSPDSLSSDTRAVLVNAIYFKGTWKDKFEKEETTDRDFHVSKEKTIQVPTMHRYGSYRYAENAELNAKLLELPYEGSEASLLIILPNEIDGIDKLVEKLNNPNVLTNATEDMFTYEVDLYLPKFKIETTTDLKEVLTNLNVKKIFSSSTAKLDNLLKGASDLFVSAAKQKAFIEVNEEGAEAAAANEFDIVFTAAMFSEFDADHPFVFIIKHESLTLFSGVFQN